MGRLPGVLVACAALAAAGCASPSADLASLPHSGPAAAVAPGLLRSESLDMALGTGATAAVPGDLPVAHAWLEAGSSGRLTIDLAPAARSLLVELAVRDGDGRLLLQALPPSAGEQTPLLADAATLYASQAADGTARIVVDGPAAGTWSVDAHADGVARAMSFTVYATSFAGPVPDGFTAVR